MPKPVVRTRAVYSTSTRGRSRPNARQRRTGEPERDSSFRPASNMQPALALTSLIKIAPRVARTHTGGRLPGGPFSPAKARSNLKAGRPVAPAGQPGISNTGQQGNGDVLGAACRIYQAQPPCGEKRRLGTRQSQWGRGPSTQGTSPDGQGRSRRDDAYFEPFLVPTANFCGISTCTQYTWSSLQPMTKQPGAHATGLEKTSAPNEYLVHSKMQISRLGR